MLRLADHLSKHCQIFFRCRGLTLLQNAVQDEVQTGQVQRHDLLLLIVVLLVVSQVLKDGFEEVAAQVSILIQA